MEKINIDIAELLRDCPTNMELDCMMYEDVYFDYVDELNIIHCYIQREYNRTSITFNQHGTIGSDIKTKCVIFPKGKTTWEGFVPPCKFKDGDILTTNLGSVFILKEPNENVFYYSCYVALNDVSRFITSYTKFCIKNGCRLATEEEKAKLFQAIKDNGYHWNAETKTLEKLPKFKVGDRVRSIYSNFQYDIKELTDTHYTLVEVESKFKYTERIIEDKSWELVPNKFDINTLVPFESKVLVRNDESQRWLPAFWGYRVIDGFITTFGWSKYCIPYNGNENLFKTNIDCDKFFKVWEE